MSYIGQPPANKLVTSSDMEDGIIVTDKLATNAVVTSKITDGTIATADVANNAITLAKMAPGTDGNIISYDTSGNPVAVATGSAGQFLKSAGAGAVPSFATIPVGGITEADQWRLTANFAPDDNNTVFITSNLERADTDGAGYIGTGMSQSSGIFTFPSTGYYLITANGIAQGNGNYMVIQTWTTTNNSSYNVASASWSWGNADSTYHSSSNCFLFDVTNTSTHKVKFGGYREGNSGTINFNGDTSQSLTSFNFLRLGDT